jgi:UPF0176 protein
MADAYLNLAAYKFLDWDGLPERRDRIQASGLSLDLRGTVLLAPEGINLFVSAPSDAANAWLRALCADPLLADLDVKRSASAQCEFGRWRVRIKKEIVTLRQPHIRPQDRRAAAIAPTTLARWMQQSHDDDGRPLKLLDTRNAFEVAAGAFESASHLAIKSFTDFPQAVRARADEFRGARVVTYCTGGIRCEKAALVMQDLGIEQVVQLDGGVLRYFEEVGQAHWQGELFVFDQRIGVDSELQATYSDSTDTDGTDTDNTECSALSNS